MGRYPAIRFRQGALEFDRPLLAGVINLTPDSFSDGGQLVSVDSAVAHALRLCADGADLLDLGGESTRPRSQPVPADAEMRRVLPVVAALRGQVRVPLSIDTSKAEVAAAALAAGAEIVNDISGGAFDPDIVRVVERAGAAFVLGHLRGGSLHEAHAAETAPPTFAEVVAELAARLARLADGLRARTLVDPGVGFGKGAAGDIELTARAGEIGATLLGHITGRPVGERDDATVGACLAAVAGGADLLRVHDVRRVHDALQVFVRVRAAAAPEARR